MKVVPDQGAGQGTMVLLAPLGREIPIVLAGVNPNSYQYQEMLGATQHMRSSIYLHDGAVVKSQLSSDGRQRLAVDDRAWHILAVTVAGEVVGCARYMAHENTISFSELGIVDSSLAKSVEWGSRLRTAVESEIELACELKIDYAEVGGWAISPKLRNTSEALRIALATYSLARILGGCVGIGTVTQRHLSSSILRRIGGKPLISQGLELPVYFDPKFGCQMEILRFESADPDPRFEVWIHDLQDYLLTVPVLSGSSSLRNLHVALGEPQPVILTPATEAVPTGGSF
jgi:hypothetical protein